MPNALPFLLSRNVLPGHCPCPAQSRPAPAIAHALCPVPRPPPHILPSALLCPYPALPRPCRTLCTGPRPHVLPSALICPLACPPSVIAVPSLALQLALLSAYPVLCYSQGAAVPADLPIVFCFFPIYVPSLPWLRSIPLLLPTSTCLPCFPTLYCDPALSLSSLLTSAFLLPCPTLQRATTLPAVPHSSPFPLLLLLHHASPCRHSGSRSDIIQIFQFGMNLSISCLLPAILPNKFRLPSHHAHLNQ